MASKSKVTPAVRQAIRSVLASNQEHKISQLTTIAGASWATGGTLAEITRTIVQGDNVSDRTGDVIILEDLRIRMHTASTGAGNATTFRVIVFADMMANGAAPGFTEILQTADYRSGYQNFNRQRRRFKILYDKFHTNVFGTQTQERILDLHFPKLHHKVYYNGTAQAVTDNGKGAVFMLVIANTATLGGWSYLNEMTYTDS